MSSVNQPSGPREDGVVVRLPPPKPLPERFGWRQGVRILALAALGGVLGYLGGRVGAQWLPRPEGPKEWSLLLLWIGPAWLLVVAWHELGHLVGGWIGGGRFLLWLVGPLKIQRTPAGIKVGWNRRVNLAGGLAACLPRDPARVTSGRFAVMILGGPLFSAVLAVAGLWAMVGGEALWPRAAVWSHWGQLALLIVAGLSALVAVATLIPMTAGGFKSDGRRVMDLLRGGPRSEQEAAMLALTAASLAGQRPAEFDPGLVARVVSLDDGTLSDLYARLIVYPHAADRGEWAAAQALLDRVVAGEAQLPAFARDAVRCEYAWLLATRTSDAAAARTWLDSAGPLDFDAATRLRAEAAVLLAEGRRKEAAEAARAGLHALEHKSLSPVKSPFAAAALQSLLTAATAA